MTWTPGPVAATPPSLFGGNEGAGNYSVGIAADIYQKYRFDLKYIGYYGDYSTNPTAEPAGGVMRAQRRRTLPVRPRLRVAHLQDHLLRRTSIMIRKTLWPRPRARSFGTAAQSRRSPPTKPSSSAPR